MGERFVVVPVDGGGLVAGETEHLDVAVPASDNDGGGSAGSGEENEALEDSVFEPQDSNAVPILEYNREPNKYGKTAPPDKLRVPLLTSPVSPMYPPSGD